MDHNMPGMHMAPTANTTDHMSQHMSLSHMSFFWGKRAEILFSGWPGQRLGMYVFALILVFLLALIVEWLSSHCQWISNDPEKCRESISNRVVKTLWYGTRIFLAYVVMLALMSFNVGVLIVAVVGHIIGFFFFGKRAYMNSGASAMC